MAFVLTQDPTYKWPVKIDVPVDGRHVTQTFDAIFRRLTQTRITEIQVEAQKLKLAMMNDQDIAGLIKDREIAEELLAGWSGIQDDKGKEIPFSESLRDQILEVPMVAASIVLAFGESIVKAKRGN